MRTECTCGVVLKDEPAINGEVSHGLCPACYASTMRAMLEGKTFVELTWERETALEDHVAALLAGDSEAVVAEAREWLALVEAEISSRGGRA